MAVIHTIALSHKRDLQCEGEDQKYSIKDLSWMISQCFKSGIKLTDWERDFLAKMQREMKQGDTYFSPRQVMTINKIYAEKTAL